MGSSIKSSSGEPIIIRIPRDLVEEGDTTPIIEGLTVFARSPSLAPQALGKIRITVSGYDADARELWEIPEVRRLVHALDQQFPFWFFFADLADEWLAAVAFCVCRVTEIAEGSTAINPSDLQRFVERQFSGMNALWDQHQLPINSNMARSDAVVAYFVGRAILN